MKIHNAPRSLVGESSRVEDVDVITFLLSAEEAAILRNARNKV